MLPFSPVAGYPLPLCTPAVVRVRGGGFVTDTGPGRCLAALPVARQLAAAVAAGPVLLDAAEVPELRYQLLLAHVQVCGGEMTFSTTLPDGGQHFLHLSVRREGALLHTTGRGDCAAIDTTMEPDGTVHGRIAAEMLAMPYYLCPLPGTQHGADADVAVCYYVPQVGPVHVGPAASTGRVTLALALRVKKLLRL